MLSNTQNYIEKLLEIYESSHKTAYIKGTVKTKNVLIQHNNALFFRWYYSTLVKGTLLSPSNLIHRICSEPDSAQKCIAPTVSLSTVTGEPYNISFSTLSYTINDHPVVKDFRIFLNNLSPSIGLTKDGTFAPAVQNALLNDLTYKDPMYLEYLNAIAGSLDLIKKAPGVHVNRICPSAHCEQYLLSSNREILDSIVSTTIKICTDQVKNLIPGYVMPLEESFILDLLKSPMTTKDILTKVYSFLMDSFQALLARGIEFEISSPQFDAPQKSSDLSLHELYQMFSSGSYMLNAMFVKYFFTPFGNYLNFISPFFGATFAFKDYQNLFNAEEYSETMLSHFMPCSHYGLTLLGKEYFDIDLSPSENNELLASIPVSELFEVLPAINGKSRGALNSLISKYAGAASSKAYRLKIKPVADEQLWKTIEVSDNFTLEQMHYCICDEFYLDPSAAYSFNTDKNLNPFTKYTPSYEAPRFKKTNTTKMRDLPLKEKDALYYTLESDSTPFLFLESIQGEEIYRIEITKIQAPAGIELFPRVLRESSTLKELGFYMDFE